MRFIMFSKIIDPIRKPKDIKAHTDSVKNMPEYRVVPHLIEIPSGKLVIANSFFILFGKKEDEELIQYMETHSGSERNVTVDYWASKGVASIPTANLSVDAFTNLENNVVNFRFHPFDDENGDPVTIVYENEHHFPVPSGGAWSVAAMDFERLKEYGEKRFNFQFDRDFDDLEAIVIDVVPGTYEFEVLNYWTDDTSYSVTYGKLKKIK